MAGQFAISLKTSSICSSRTPLSPLNHKQLSGFFLSFSLQRLSEPERNHFNFQLTRGTRIDHEQFACNVVAHVVDRAVFNFNVICDLHSPDTFDTHLGEWASTNVQPCPPQNISGFSNVM